MTKPVRILLGAHTIDPRSGGERGIGWAWAEGLARNPRVGRVEVMAHPMAREAIEQRLRDDAVLGEKLGFHWVLPPKRIDPWPGDRPGTRTWHRLLLHYQLWQRCAARSSAYILDRVDVAHHVTFGNIFLRTFVSSLPVPYIIGPVGGGQAPTVRDAGHVLAESRDVHGAIELLRSALMPAVSRRPALRSRLAKAVAVLCANSQTLAVARRYQIRSELMVDGGIDHLPKLRATLNEAAPTVLWVGKMEARKDPFSAISVAEELRHMVGGARLVMIGDGWLHDRVRREVVRRGLTESVELRGAIPHGEMKAAYAEASIFMFTSHRDTFGVQNLEAMSHGLPVVFRSSPGVSVGDFSGSGSIGVAPDAFPRLAAERIAHTIHNSSEWDRLSAGALAAARQMTWASKIERVVELFYARGSTDLSYRK